MGLVMKIEWLGGVEGPSEASQHQGRYVSRYDPDAHGGRGEVWTVVDPREALQFDSLVALADFHRQVSKVKPLREDGKPNRPITAYTVSIFDWEKA